MTEIKNKQITIKNNRIQLKIKKGVDSSFVVNNAGGWDQYDEIRMDIKYDELLVSSPLLRYTLGDGIEIDGTRLIVTIPNSDSRTWKGSRFYADIKLKQGDVVLPPIPIDIITSNTVTDI